MVNSLIHDASKSLANCVLIPRDSQGDVTVTSKDSFVRDKLHSVQLAEWGNKNVTHQVNIFCTALLLKSNISKVITQICAS